MTISDFRCDVDHDFHRIEGLDHRAIQRPNRNIVDDKVAGLDDVIAVFGSTRRPRQVLIRDGVHVVLPSTIWPL